MRASLDYVRPDAHRIEFMASGVLRLQDVPRGVHQYKFIVDDKWQCAHDQPQMKDGGGNTNNILDISNYQRFQAAHVPENKTLYATLVCMCEAMHDT